MNPDPGKRINAGTSVRALLFVLATMLVVGLWMLADLNAVGAVLGGDEVEIRVGRTEFILILVLLLLNVLMTTTLLKRFGTSGRLVRNSFTVTIASFLAMSVWIAIRFIPPEIDTPGESMHGRLDSIEIILAGALLLSSALGALLLLRRFLKARPIVTMSSYSKEVCVRGKWMPIEEYLRDELGIDVSHGMTPGERDAVMENFRRISEKQGIPHPHD